MKYIYLIQFRVNKLFILILRIFYIIILSVIIFILLGVFQIIFLILPFRIYASNLTKAISKSHDVDLKNISIGQLSDNLSKSKLFDAILIGKIVSRISNYTLWPNKCLVQALVTKFLLRQFKIANALVIGVNFEANGVFKAHAWITVQSIIKLNYMLDNSQFSDTAQSQVLIVIGGKDSAQQFKIIKVFNDYYIN